MSYEKRINSLSQEALDDAFNEAYHQERQRLIDTEQGLQELCAGILLYYGVDHINKLRAIRDGEGDESVDALINLRRLSRTVANKMALNKAHEKIREISEHNEETALNWRD